MISATLKNEDIKRASDVTHAHIFSAVNHPLMDWLESTATEGCQEFERHRDLDGCARLVRGYDEVIHALNQLHRCVVSQIRAAGPAADTRAAGRCVVDAMGMFKAAMPEKMQPLIPGEYFLKHDVHALTAQLKIYTRNPSRFTPVHACLVREHTFAETRAGYRAMDDYTAPGDAEPLLERIQAAADRALSDAQTPVHAREKILSLNQQLGDRLHRVVELKLDSLRGLPVAYRTQARVQSALGTTIAELREALPTATLPDDKAVRSFLRATWKTMENPIRESECPHPALRGR